VQEEAEMSTKHFCVLARHEKTISTAGDGRTEEGAKRRLEGGRRKDVDGSMMEQGGQRSTEG
jgi:hypothetical protein